MRPAPASLFMGQQLVDVDGEIHSQLEHERRSEDIEQPAMRRQMAPTQEPCGSDVHTSAKRFVLRTFFSLKWDSSMTFSSVDVKVEERFLNTSKKRCRRMGPRSIRTEPSRLSFPLGTGGTWLSVFFLLASSMANPSASQTSGRVPRQTSVVPQVHDRDQK